MKMKRNKLVLIVLICSLVLVVSGCDNKNTIKSGGERVNVSKMQHKHCTRQGVGTGIETSLSYDLYYTGEALNVLKSVEKVTSDSEDTLKSYEEAYQKIFSNYEGLKYYDAEVKRDDSSVTSTIVINYDKIDINKLLEIEGEEDNIIENGQAKVDKWLELSKKFGTECKEVVDNEENSGA